MFWPATIAAADAGVTLKLLECIYIQCCLTSCTSHMICESVTAVPELPRQKSENCWGSTGDYSAIAPCHLRRPTKREQGVVGI